MVPGPKSINEAADNGISLSSEDCKRSGVATPWKLSIIHYKSLDEVGNISATPDGVQPIASGCVIPCWKIMSS